MVEVGPLGCGDGEDGNVCAVPATPLAVVDTRHVAPPQVEDWPAWPPIVSAATAPMTAEATHPASSQRRRLATATRPGSRPGLSVVFPAGTASGSRWSGSGSP